MSIREFVVMRYRSNRNFFGMSRMQALVGTAYGVRNNWHLIKGV